MASIVDKSVFAKASSIKDALNKKESKEVAALYKDWAGQIGELADYYDKKPVPSAAIQSQYYQQLKNQVTEWSKQVANGVYSKAGKNMNIVADAVVADNAKWMSSLGFTDKAIDAAFSDIPQSTVNALLTGSVYGGTGSWSLSKAIWGDNQDTLKHIYQIVAQGVVMQMPTGDIARKLEQYVNPSKQFKWNGPEGYPPIYGKKVDYNAQRLVRTLTQHTYQQSIVATAKANPFIQKIRWVSNGSRVCPLCMERDGKVFPITKVPLDHPNGQCVMEPVIDADMVDKLADWVTADEGTYPELDKKMQVFGYKPGSPNFSDVMKHSGRVATKAVEKLTEQQLKAQQDYIEWRQNVLDNVHDVIGKKQVQELLGDEETLSAYFNFYKQNEDALHKSGVSYVQDLIEAHLKGKDIKGVDFSKLDSMLASKFPGLSIKPGKTADKLASDLAKKAADEVAKKASKAKSMTEAEYNAWKKAKANKYSILMDEDEAKKLLGNDVYDAYRSFFNSHKKELYNDFIETPEALIGQHVGSGVFHNDELDAIIADKLGAKDVSSKFAGKIAKKKAEEEIASKAKEEAKKAQALVDAKIQASKVKKASEKVEDNTSWRKRFESFRTRGYIEDSAEIKRLKDSEKTFFDDFDKYQIRGLKSYTGNGYVEINDWLRSKDAWNLTYAHEYGVTDSVARNVSDLKDKMKSVKTTERMTLRRGTDVGDLAGLFMKGDWHDNFEELKKKTPEELNAAFKGAQGTYTGFTSTSSVYSRGFANDVEIIFDAPEGTHGMSILTKSRYKDSEGEFLLAPDTKVECTGIEASDDNHMNSKIRVFLKIITD